MHVETTRVAPADLTTKHLGSYVVAEESGGQMAGGLSDVRQCPPRPGNAPAGAAAPVVLSPIGECTLPRTDGHTHLWLGGQTQVVSHARGRVYVTAPVVPTEHPGGTP